jgi:hypothetical protein
VPVLPVQGARVVAEEVGNFLDAGPVVQEEGDGRAGVSMERPRRGRLAIRANTRRRSLGSTGVPTSEANMRPWSWYSAPAASFSAAWRDL